MRHRQRILSNDPALRDALDDAQRTALDQMEQAHGGPIPLEVNLSTDRDDTEAPPPCPRCGLPMEKIAAPDDYWDDATWVWGHDCLPD